MKKNSEFCKKSIKKISFLSIILLVVFVNISNVFAGYMDEETNGNKKEQQLFDRIDAIKEAFPNQIDKEALYATIVHRGTLTDYINDSYDENFDKEEYKNSWSDFGKNVTNLINNIGGSFTVIGDAILSQGECLVSNDSGENEDKYDDNCVINKMIEKAVDRENSSEEGSLVSVEGAKKPKSIDLLAAATIVMLDSSGWTGTYSDENYKKALAGNSLTGNVVDENDIFGTAASFVINGWYCGVARNAELVVGGDWFNPGVDFADNGDFGSQQDIVLNRYSRYYTMTNICENGFIGGTYDHVKNPDLSTDEGKAQYQGKKDIVAEQIINLAKKFRGNGDNCLYVGTSGSGDMVNWKQTDPRWSNLTLGSGGLTVGNAGCTATSMTYLIAKSGTTLTVPSIDPGVFVKNASFTSSNLIWNSWSSIAPNFKMHTQGASVNVDNAAEVLSNVLNTPYDGQYQQFVILYLSLGHWVAVDHIENGKVYVFDPSPSADGEGIVELSKAYKGSSLKSYNAFHATDVPFGSTGTSSPSVSGGDNCDDGVTSGSIVIPEQYGNGGFTVTFYSNSDNSWNWSRNSNQGKLYYDYWLPSGATFDNGIATYQGRYLIACTTTFGNVGDMVDFFLEDGTKIQAIIADIKSSSDAGYNEWGHNNGQNVLEFEVSRAYFKQYGNPGNSNWFPEWAGKRVASATNLGSIW